MCGDGASELRVRVMWLQWLPLPLLNLYRRSCCGLVQAILTRNGVSYHGCVERSDLVDKVCSIGDRRAHGGAGGGWHGTVVADHRPAVL